MVEQGTISRAARILNIAQPPLSKRLQELEEEVGAPLFLRGTKKKIEPTPAGYHLYRRACEILRRVDDAARETALLARAETRTLRIGLSHLYQNYFESLLLEIHRKNPDKQIAVSILDSSNLELHLRNGLIDVALIQKPEHTHGFDCITFAPVRTVAVLHQSLCQDAAAGDVPISLAELARWPLVLLKRAEGSAPLTDCSTCCAALTHSRMWLHMPRSHAPYSAGCKPACRQPPCCPNPSCAAAI